MDIINDLPLVTDFPSRKHWEAAVWEILVSRLAKIESEAELKKALNFLLSPRERHNLVFRALAASRIKSKIGMREIGRELWIAFPTISAIKKSLDEGDYKSSHSRGHIKRKYSPSSGPLPPRPKKIYYRKIKGGQIKDWTIMQ